jgi:hypothetical protein
MRTGLNDASGVVWALGEYIILRVFLTLTNVLCIVLIYVIHDREGRELETTRTGPNDTGCIVWGHRVITTTGMIWYHDRIFTGPSLVYECQDLTSITTENAVMAFYARSPLT